MTDPYPTFSTKVYYEITENHPGTGCQVLFPITYAEGMGTQFEHIRFSDGVDAEVPYYIDSYVESTSANVWIKLSASNYITLHYGDTSSSSASSGTDTFDLFDDFAGTNGASPNLELWTVEHGGTGSGSILLNGSGSVVISPAQTVSNAEALVSIQTFSQGIVINISNSVSGARYVDVCLGEDVLQAGNALSDWWHPSLGDGIRFTTQNIGNATGSKIEQTTAAGTLTQLSTCSNIPYPVASTAYTHEYTWASSLIKWTRDGTVISQNTSDMGSTASYRIAFSPGELYDGNGAILTLDRVYVRKYYATSPTFAEIPAPIGAGGIFPSGIFPTNIFPSGIFQRDLYFYYYIHIFNDEEITMNQIPGTTQNQPIQILDSSGNVVTGTGSNVSVYYSLNGGDVTAWTPAPTISVYNTYMRRHQIEIPSAIGDTTFDSGDTLEVSVIAAEGSGYIKIYFGYGGISTGGGSESVITSYTLDASEKTIDTTDTTLTIEQIKYILNLTTGNEIYDSSNPRKRRLQMTAPADQVGIDISIASGVISYIESSAMTDDDKIKIVVESAHI